MLYKGIGSEIEKCKIIDIYKEESFAASVKESIKAKYNILEEKLI